MPLSVPHLRAKTLPSDQPKTARWKTLRAQLDGGNELFRAGRYIQANKTFKSVFEHARKEQIPDLAARAGGNTGSCQFALHQYRTALASFLEARSLAAHAGDTSEIAILDSNIASLYTEIGDLDTAAHWILGTMDGLSSDDRRRFLPAIQIQLALLRARQGRMAEALASFRQGIDAADRSGDTDLYSVAWNRLGVEYLNRKDFSAAERAFLEAFRVRKFAGLSLESSYRNLGRLRMEQGDLESASHLLDRCLELTERPGGALPAWDVYHSRGRIRLAQGRLREALDDLRIALRLARAWRWSAPSNGSARLGTEEMLDQVYSALIEAGNRLYLRTHDPALARETFEAAEENRAASLRALSENTRTAPDLSPEYWEALLRLQRAEVACLRAPSDISRSEALDARAALAHLESAGTSPAGEVAGAAGLLAHVQAALDPDTALFSFHLGDSISWLWTVDRSGLSLTALPSRRAIQAQTEAASAGIRQDATASGAALYRTLFGSADLRFRAKSRWLLALDPAGLYDVPVAALVVSGTTPRPVYVAEQHSTLAIPGAVYWLQSISRRPSGSPSPVFVGVGDAIYNAADPRFSSERQARSSRSHPLAASAARGLPFLALPRLVASGPELEACAHAWGGTAVLLRGADASRERLQQQLVQGPAVLHFATHFLPAASGPTSGWIALSVNPRGEAELLSPEEISHWKINTPLVVLSGCQSAAGAALPGSGLLGLTRAWLAAGARCVIGSRWNTPDDNGALFAALYSHLRGRRRKSASEALRAAQVVMIRSGGWRSRPSFWGAYLTVGAE